MQCDLALISICSWYLQTKLLSKSFLIVYDVPLNSPSFIRRLAELIRAFEGSCLTRPHTPGYCFRLRHLLSAEDLVSELRARLELEADQRREAEDENVRSSSGLLD